MRTPLFCVLLLSSACLGDDPKGEEEELLDDTKADSQISPTQHGAIEFGTPGHAALTGSERYHAWTFELSGNAKVDMTTSYSVLGQRRTDTVLYLYKFKESTTSWGPYVARNDDYGTTIYSQLKRDLTAGRYRIIVKGHVASTLGKFKVSVGCSGEGCAPVNAGGCVFGSTYGDIAGDPNLLQQNKIKITPANLATLPADDQHRLMLAVQQSSHTDVTTPLEALMRVDQDEVNVTWLVDLAARRRFLAFEYGAGDNSYGAIFDRDSAQMVTNIHDGDLENCIVAHETCALSSDWYEMRNDPAFVTESTRVITAANQLTGVGSEQALLAFRSLNDSITTVAEGLANVDDDRLNIVSMRQVSTGVRLEVFEFGAGDNSFGRIYYRGTTGRAGLINDLFIEACTLYQ
jgi:hypothetical protein